MNETIAVQVERDYPQEINMRYFRTLWRIIFYTSVVLTLTRCNSIGELPMERLNLWIDRKEIEQFVGKSMMCVNHY